MRMVQRDIEKSRMDLLEMVASASSPDIDISPLQTSEIWRERFPHEEGMLRTDLIPDSSVDPMDMEKVLHGSSIGYDLGSGTLNKELRQWTQRSRQGTAVSYEEGLFNGRHKGFLAVLKCTGDFRNANGCELSIWVNPYADLFRIPQPLFPLKTYSLSRQIDCTPPA